MEKANNQQAEFTKSCLRNAAMTEEKRTARKAAMKKMYEELKDEKTDLIAQKEEFDRELENTDDTDPMKNVIRNKIRVVEEKLTNDYFQNIEAAGGTIPAALAPIKARVTYSQVSENNNPNKPFESKEARALREIAEVAAKVHKRHDEEEEAARKAQADLL